MPAIIRLMIDSLHAVTMAYFGRETTNVSRRLRDINETLRTPRLNQGLVICLSVYQSEVMLKTLQIVQGRRNLTLACEGP
jgi:hypothetical protein